MRSEIPKYNDLRIDAILENVEVEKCVWNLEVRISADK